MFVYNQVLGVVMDILSMDLHIDVVFQELVLPSVERITTAIWYEIDKFFCKKGDLFHDII
jgi:hypothetical protein